MSVFLGLNVNLDPDKGNNNFKSALIKEILHLYSSEFLIVDTIALGFILVSMFLLMFLKEYFLHSIFVLLSL